MQHFVKYNPRWQIYHALKNAFRGHGLKPVTSTVPHGLAHYLASIPS